MTKYIYFCLVAICFLLQGCLSSHPSNEIDSLAERVIEKKEGVQITVEPINSASSQPTK